MNLIKDAAWFLSLIFALYTGYFYFIALFSFLPRKKTARHAPKTRFGILIAARNEEAVIGNLIDSLKSQTYPADLFDVIVIPNNCSDNTRGAAIDHGASVFDCRRVIKSKGDALEEYFDTELAGSPYDAYCVFDADNVASSGFLEAMNSAVLNGAEVAQGYRDSKNPDDSVISASYTVYYTMVNRFFNRARSRLGLSAMVNGSGFVVTSKILREQGGWHTRTMTEDIEFTTLNILKDRKVDWVPEALFYDEQPLTFRQSWHQRKRWSTGLIQGMQLYFLPHLKRIFRGKLSSLDMLMFYSAPVIQIVFSLLFILDSVLNVMYIKHDFFPQTDIFYRMFLSVFSSYLITAAVSAVVVLFERKRKVVRGILFYWIFVLSWIPISLICLFKKQTDWVPILHTRNLGIDQVLQRTGAMKKRSA